MEKQKNKGGRKKGSGNQIGSFNVRIPNDVAKIIRERYGNTNNERLSKWIRNNLFRD